MTLALFVALAAGAGAVLRLLVDVAVSRRAARLPHGTLAVNVSGSLVLGLAVALAARGRLGEDALVVVGTGLTGGFTTLSTWAVQTRLLLDDGARTAALLNVLLTALLCPVAAAAGLLLGQG